MRDSLLENLMFLKCN